MVKRNRLGARRLSLVAVVVMLGAWLATTSPSTADVTAANGQAYGYFLDATVPITGRVTRGPAPIVTFPPGGPRVSRRPLS